MAKQRDKRTRLACLYLSYSLLPGLLGIVWLFSADKGNTYTYAIMISCLGYAALMWTVAAMLFALRNYPRPDLRTDETATHAQP